MSLLSRIAGTVASFFQIGGSSGPGLANDGGSGNVGAYNATQSAYVNVRAADPVIANDLVTLEYLQANTSFPDYVTWPNGTFTVASGVAKLQVQDTVFSQSTHVVLNGRMVWVK